ncbi:MAG: Mur ligase family protein [Patescibacteria group bacterium]|nr:Mur ligase family protein [Patescibacteria group bacterium]
MLKSTMVYILRVLARLVVVKYRPEIIGITGSVGKTSTKETITIILKSRFNARASVKNYNNEIGLPLTILGIEKTPARSIFGWIKAVIRGFSLLISKDKNYPEILVLEMGADKPGDIQYLTDIAPCKVGVLTCISHAHTEFFKTIKRIAQEKRIIISRLPHDGFAILNFDNELVMQNASATKAEIVTYGLKNGADFQAMDLNFIEEEETGWTTGLNFKVEHKGSVVPVFLPGAVSLPLVSAALSGLAVGSVFGINLVEGAEALKKLTPLPGHMRLIKGIKDTLIIDDTYNSSPEAVKSALETLKKIKLKEGAEHYAVLGDMLELGLETENIHREIGFKVAELEIDFLITVGEASKHTAIAAKEAGLAEHQVASFADSASAGRFLQEKLEKGDVVLIKGSQSVRAEKIVKEVMAEPLRAKELLVRQTGEWANK